MCSLYIDSAKTIPTRPNALPSAGIMFLEDGWDAIGAIKQTGCTVLVLMTSALVELWPHTAYFSRACTATVSATLL